MTTNNSVNVGLSGATGTGNFVGANTPTLITPVLGAATGTSIAFSPTTGGIIGTATNDNAGAGKVGEVISSIIALSGATSISSANTATAITSLSLTAGDWDVVGNLFFINAGSVFTALAAAINTSVALPDASLYNSFAVNAATTGFNVPSQRISLSSPATAYLIGYASFVSGTATGCGSIYARRAR